MAVTSIPMRVVPHNGKNLLVSDVAFGPDTYPQNMVHIQEARPPTGDAFRPATISESVSIANYRFKELIETQIFDTQGLQLGYVVMTSEGVFTNTTEKQRC